MSFPRSAAPAITRSENWSAALPRGSHPFPSRTRSLSLAGRMVLHGRLCGRVRRRRPFYSKARLQHLVCRRAFMHPGGSGQGPTSRNPSTAAVFSNLFTNQLGMWRWVEIWGCPPVFPLIRRVRSILLMCCSGASAGTNESETKKGLGVDLHISTHLHISN
jgi:hypothetical protein